MIVLETIAHRWWALAFIPVYFWAARADAGIRRAIRFLAIASVVSFLAEYSSTHWGFPFGRYAYIARDREIFLSNVPLFVPLCWGVVVWAGRAVARPLIGWRLAVASGIAAAIIDLVIDPITLRGSAWFEGPLYAYRARGGWFGAPWSNYAGWILVSAVIVAIDELISRSDPIVEPRSRWLAYGTCAFFVILGFAIGETRIALAGLAVTVALIAAVNVARARRGSRRSPS